MSAAKKKRRQTPSRERYERENPTASFRLDRKTYERLKEHLSGTKSSFADFVRDSLGREDSTIAARVEILAARSMEDRDYRLRCLEELVSQILFGLGDEAHPRCPFCANPLLVGRGRLMELHGTPIKVYGCPECDFFVDAYYRIDPDTIEWAQHEE